MEYPWITELKDAELFVQPGDSFFPITDAIDSAREDIRLTVYRLDCPAIQDALVAAAHRGVDVTVLVAPQRREWKKKGEKLLERFQSAGVHAVGLSKDCAAAAGFHYKVMTVDKRATLAFTFNPTRTNMHYCRDFGILVRDQGLAEQVNRILAEDECGKVYAGSSVGLLLAPDNARERLLQLFEGAKRSIHLFDTRVDDDQILAVLERKAKEGVQVRVLGSKSDYGPGEVSSIFRGIARFELHAKAGIIDRHSFYVGSLNLRPKALDSRRELAIIGTNPQIAANLETIFLADWEGGCEDARPDETVLLTRASRNGAVDLGGECGDKLMLASRLVAVRQFLLCEGEMHLGRADDNDVVVKHPSVSRKHATIARQGPKLAVKDLGSANGTWINGSRVEGEQPLQLGDVITVAEGEEFRVVQP